MDQAYTNEKILFNLIKWFHVNIYCTSISIEWRQHAPWNNVWLVQIKQYLFYNHDWNKCRLTLDTVQAEKHATAVYETEQRKEPKRSKDTDMDNTQPLCLEISKIVTTCFCRFLVHFYVYSCHPSDIHMTLELHVSKRRSKTSHCGSNQIPEASVAWHVTATVSV